MKYKYLVLLLIGLKFTGLSAQNLLTNGDFESGENGVGFTVDAIGYTKLNQPFSGTSSAGNYGFTTNPKLLSTAKFFVGADHTTGTGTGKMMVVDGTTDASYPRFWRAGNTGGGVCGLVPGQAYIFSYWIKSVSIQVIDDTTKAAILLESGGITNLNLVSGSSFAPLPSGGWQKVVYTFEATDDCATIALWNSNLSASGNDFALDDLMLYAQPTATISGTTELCYNAPAPLVTFTGYNGIAPYTFTYNINGGASQTISTTSGNSVTLSVPTTTSGIFNYNLTQVSYGGGTPPAYTNVQSGTATVKIEPSVTISGDVTICPGNQPVLTFNGTPNATVSFQSDDSTVYSVVLDATGKAVFKTPVINVTTTFSLISVSIPSCPTPAPVSGFAEITINNSSACDYTLVSDHKAFSNIIQPASICKGFNETTILKANYLPLYFSNEYVATEIPYVPFYGFLGGEKLSVSQDDTWSPVQNLPFNFSFYGTNYNKALVGANGILSFNLSPTNPGGGIPGGTEVQGGLTTGLGGNGCSWKFTEHLLNAAERLAFPERNAILGVYQDINPATIVDPTTQNINYYVAGTAPNRAFVVNTTDFPLFFGACAPSGLQTYQIVIYESTNIIDVFVKRRTSCSTWNNGNGVIGIINQDATKGLAPYVSVANNQDTGTWTATQKAYRFKPNGVQMPIEIKWYEGNSATPFSTANQVEVTPTEDNTFYRLEVIYTRADGTKYTLYDYVNVDKVEPLPLKYPKNITKCTNDPGPYTYNLNQNDYMLDGVNPLYYAITYHKTEEDAKYEANKIINLNDFVVANASDLPITIYVRISDMENIQACTNIRKFVLNLRTSQGSISYANTNYCMSSTVDEPVINSANLTPGGKYISSSPLDLKVNPDTGAIDLDGSNVGTYTVVYTVPALDDCPEYSTNAVTITIEPCCVTTALADFDICLGDVINLSSSTTNPTATYLWSGPGSFSSTDQNPSLGSPSVAGDYVYTVTASVGGVACSSDSVTVSVHELPYASFLTPSSSTICTNDTANINFTGQAGSKVTFNAMENGASSVQEVYLNAGGLGTYTSPSLTQTAFYELVSVQRGTSPLCTVNLAPSGIEVHVGLPDAQITNVADPVVCFNTGTSITLQGTPGSLVHVSKTDVLGTVYPQQDVPLDATSGIGTLASGNLSSDTTFTLIDIVSASCSNTISGQSVVVTVKALPVLDSFTSDKLSVCSGSGLTLYFTGTPGATVRYTADGGTTSIPVLLDGLGSGSDIVSSLTSATTFDIVDMSSGGSPVCVSSPSIGSISVSIIELAQITSELAGLTTICPGTDFVFTAVATGTGLDYKWFKDGFELTNSGNITGATSAQLSITGVTASNAGDYHYSVSNSCNTATSAIGKLVVSESTNIVSVQAQDNAVCEGETIKLTIIATGTALTYQWYKGGVAVSDSATVSGATGNVLTITTAVASDAGLYSCTVNNSCLQPVSSSDVAITVDTKPHLVDGPDAVDSCAGSNISLSVEATGSSLTYQWYKGPTALVNGVRISGATGNVLQITGTLVSDSGSYYCIVGTTGECPASSAVTSAAVAVNIKEAPSIDIQPEPLEICTTEDIVLSVTTPAGSGFTYQWQLGQVNLPGQTSPSLLIPNATSAHAGLYRVVVSSGSCPSLNSIEVLVQVNPTPVITKQPDSGIVCAGSTISLSTVATGNNLTYEWKFNGVTLVDGGRISGATSASLSIVNSVTADQGQYRCIVTSATCPPVPSVIATILVRALPTASLTTQSGAEFVICADEGTQINFSGTANALVTYTANGVAHTILLNSSGSATLQTGDLDETTVYSLVQVRHNDNPSCTVDLNESVTVKVNPLPVTDLDDDGFICIDSQTGFVMQTYTLDTGLDIVDYSFEWFFNGVLIPGADQGSYVAYQVGNYMVKATDRLTNCSKSSDQVGVVSSSPPVKVEAEVESNYFDDNATIVVTVSPVGDYEYRLDDGPYQQSNIFSNVSTVSAIPQSGSHTVWVRDLKACGEEAYKVTVIDYPRYFTPNGDGYHDTWNISTLSNQPNAKIYIFDRFGKLLKQISTTSAGWDGTFNGQPMTADDYWFVIKYSEEGINKEFKAHFAMKR